jgi:predicted dehydrogenase
MAALTMVMVPVLIAFMFVQRSMVRGMTAGGRRRGMEMKTLKVGIIGCGSIAQEMHLPFLRELNDRYEIAALCDLSEGLLHALARDYGVRHTYTDYQELLDRAEIDAVMVLSKHHAPAAIAAARAGKHVFVEKPMVVNLPEADELIDSARSTGVKVMVGYMKRYDPGYLAGLKELESIRDVVNLIELHDIIGPNTAFETHHKVYRFGDIPKDILAPHDAAYEAACRGAIGDAPAHVKSAYNLLLGLSTHDVTILRGAFGSPEKVLSAEIWNGGAYITATLRYPGDCRCVFYTGLHNVARFDERLTFVSPERILEIAFPSPYLKNVPTLVHLHEQREGAYRTETTIASYEEAFKEELVHFHDCIVRDQIPRTSAADSRKDHELLLDIIQAYRARQQ